MVDRWKDKLALPALIAAVLAMLYWRYHRIFACPSCFLFLDEGDGLKNYFTPAWWVTNDSGLWFSGMNYPYGEHPVYTDNQPAWSLLLKLLDAVLPMREHVIGTLNMMMLLSVVVGAVAVYLILRQSKLPRWYAAIVSLPIIFLSPQLDRFNGHYSLAYVYYLPIFLLLLIRWIRNGQKLRGGVALTFWISWMGFTHLYFFFIAIIFLAAYCGVSWLRQRIRWSPLLTRTIAVMIASVISVYVTIKVTDPVNDRPKEVYGLLVYTATPKGTFLPWYDTWPTTWKEKLDTNTPDIESKSYVGLVAVLLFPIILFLALRDLALRWRKRPDAVSEDLISPGSIAWSGALVWLFATGWFYEIGGSVLVDIFPVLGQFRSLGRLAWIFYYTLNLYTVWIVYRWIMKSHGKLRVVAIVCASMLAILWIRESAIFSYDVTKGIFRPNSVFRGDTPYLDLLREQNLSPDDFQAIFQIPDLCVGTENLPLMRGHWEFNKTMQCAWETGLSIVNYEMSRTSVEHGLSLLQLISTPDIPKRRLSDMNDKPLLLLTYISPHLPTEMRLIGIADSIGRVGTMDVYRLPVTAFMQPPMPDSLSWDLLAHEGFEHESSDLALAGNGAHKALEGEQYFSYEHTTDTADSLRFSCWVYIGKDTPGFPAMRVIQTDQAGAQIEEQVVSIHSFDPWQVRGNWVQILFPLNPKAPNARFTFSTLSRWALIDEIVVERLRVNE